MREEHNLQRFLDAQETDYPRVLAEIKNGKKQSHWMWYIFPQIQGLGYSSTSQFYAIKDLQEAQAYLKHPLLGSRLVSICEELLNLESQDARAILGSPDDLKLKSSMTLFSALPNTKAIFQSVLDKFYQGNRDHKTLQIISKQTYFT
jgi:uncharacterized protein (DUF1810 family)